MDAVRGVSFDVQQGEFFAFLGPNGAGKSTTINILCTLARPTSGGATVAGFDVMRQPRCVRENIGMVFQTQTLDPHLTAEENLRFHAVLYRIPRTEAADRIERVLQLVSLADRKRSQVSTFSGGMRRRLEIARALLHTPRILFLDEPTVGLDPYTRAQIWRDVLRLRDEANVTIFLTTHYLDEADKADRIAIIDQGQIITCDTPTALKTAVGADAIDLLTTDDVAARTSLTRAGYDVHITPEGVRVYAPNGERAVGALTAATEAEILHLRMHRPTLDDVFMHFTGREIHDSENDLTLTNATSEIDSAGNHP